jgi:hypothetical protein
MPEPYAGPQPRLVPYWQPPENLASDQRCALLWVFEHEIRAAQGQLTPKQLAVKLLTRLDLQGWGPGQRPATTARPAGARRGWCDTHGAQHPCRGCAADRKAAPDHNDPTRSGA